MIVSRSIVPAALALLACFGQPAAHAAPISYEGLIANYSSVTGTVGGFGMVDDDASSVDFWTIFGIAGAPLTLQATRLDSPLDLVLTLYFGTTTADAVLFRHDLSFGGLRLIAMGDDEVPPPGNIGPFGDPLLRIIFPSTGLYTIAIGGFASDANGPYRYRLAAAVPTPATLPLLLTGLVIAFVAPRRRASRSAIQNASTMRSA